MFFENAFKSSNNFQHEKLMNSKKLLIKLKYFSKEISQKLKKGMYKK